MSENVANSDNRKYEDEEIARIHNSYLEYNKTVRAWFIGYGVGLPALILTQDDLYKKFSSEPNMLIPCIVFFSCVLLQVISSMANKWSNWIRYNKIQSYGNIPSWAIKMAEMRRNMIISGFFVDVLCIVFFAIATCWGFYIAFSC